MKLKSRLFLLFTALLVIAGCKTTTTEVKPLSWSQQQAYLKTVRDPRMFGLGIYDTPSGPQIRGGGRLHPERAEALPMQPEIIDEEKKTERVLRPIVILRGPFGDEWPVLLDCASTKSWFEFDAAQKLGARPVAERDAVLVHLPGDEVNSCLSVISSLRLGFLYIEDSLVYVRMATGPLGEVTRGITLPEVKGVIGWDLLRKFERIQFLYSLDQIALFTTEKYTPNPNKVIATLKMVKQAPVCMVRGMVDGKECMIQIDPAGDFEMAAGGAVSSIQLSPDLIISGATVKTMPGGVRIGAQFLKDYQVSICPKEGLIYIEESPVLEEKE